MGGETERSAVGTKIEEETIQIDMVYYAFGINTLAGMWHFHLVVSYSNVD